MIFSKKVNIIVYSIVSVFLIVGIIMIVRINSLYPNAKVVDNTENGYIVWRGCKIEPVSMKVYSPQEYVDTYHDYAMLYDYLLTNRYDDDKEGIVVYKVKITNDTSEKIDFKLHGQAYACSEPSMWCNGLAPMSPDHEIEAGDTVEYIVAAAYQPTLVNNKYINKMDKEEYQLIFSNYPEKIILRFNNEK